MKRLTLAGRLLITALIVGALYAGYKYMGGEALLQKSADKTEASAEFKTPEPTEGTDSQASDTQSETTPPSASGFAYTAPVPVNGKLRGVVELGASGFNFFVIEVDGQKRWKLAKSEFGNSLIKEHLATDEDIRIGLKKYIGNIIDFGVPGKDIHFVVSSGAAKEEVTTRIVRVLKSMGYVVNTVTPEKEGELALRSILPTDYNNKAYVVDIGSGNTKISWIEGGKIKALETYGAKYYQNNVSDDKVTSEVSSLSKQIPTSLRGTCFIIGGVPFELAKEVRQNKERYTVLKSPGSYKLENAKSKAGANIYQAIRETTGTQQFVFDWDANFTIGFLLNLPQ